MAEHRGESFAHRRTPERDDAIRVAEMQNRIVAILAHDVARSQARVVASREFSSAYVVPLHVSRLPHRREKKVVGEVIQAVGARMLLHAVDLHSIVVVNVRVLALCDCEKGLVVKILHVVDVLLELQLRPDFHAVAVVGRDMPLSASKEQMPEKTKKVTQSSW